MARMLAVSSREGNLTCAFNRPSLVPDLMTIVETQTQIFLSNPTGADPANTLNLKRTLRVLGLVIKEFCSIKMPSGIRTMTQIAESLYAPLISCYDKISSLLQASFTVDALLDPQLQNTCEEVIILCHMVFKPCSRIMLWLWQKADQPKYSAALNTVSSMFCVYCFDLLITECAAFGILAVMFSAFSDSF